VEALEREIEERAKKFKDYEIQTIFFGGGTPSLIDPFLIQKIIQKIHQKFRTKKYLEISIECNPESVDAARLKIYKKSGITRFSLGVQSLNPKTLLRVARPHDSKTIFKALEIFKSARIKNFGTDLIMGLPYQTLQSFQQEVEKILSYEPKHLSFYFLSYDTKKIDLFLKECPQEDEQIKMYEWLCDRLKKAGFIHYEVSNWAKPGFECEHNKRYWEQKDYLGLGLGAHSIVDGKMWENQKNFDEYLKNPTKIENEMTIDEELKRMEYIMLKLRTHQGIDLQYYRKQFGNEAALLQNAESYIVSQDLQKTATALKATEKGFLLLDKITKDLL